MLDYSLKLLDARIAHNDILSLHELIFCADLDFLFLMLYTRSAHKDIFLLYELTSYAVLY